MEQPLIVQAEYSFKGGNNDELCFKKGDLITVTQREEGGWWEGTLNDKTGWFPSNYVNEYKAPLPLTETIRPPEEIQEYRSVVLKDLLDSERAHVAEIQGLLENFLEPLQQTQILNSDEYAQLMCNFVEVVKTHEELLTQMEECNDRVGKLFLTKAPLMKQVHQTYCAAHPKAIVILDKYKDELEKYMERQGAASPGLLVLTTGLSKPFRRLDKYSAMLQELERHMESSHPDRGDTQRSVAVYKDIAAICSATRRQKELELQVLTGPVRGWQGQELSSLGDIIHMGSVAVGPDHRDRYFVLFPQTLLILSVSQRMSAFIYEGKLPLTNIIVNRLEDSDTYKNAFEISGPLIDRIVAVCQGPNEANKWVELLTTTNSTMPIGIKRQVSNLSNSSLGGVGHVAPPSHNPHILDVRGYCTRFSLCAYYNASPCTSYHITLPPSNYPPTAPYTNLSAHFAKLVKKGLLKSAIVKMLLYPQARQSIDLKTIPLREKRTQKSKIQKKKQIKEYNMEITNSSERIELERQDAFELPTDSESDDDEEYGVCDSDPFEYIKFHANKRDSIYASTGTFIDYGPEMENIQPSRHLSSINLIKLDSDSTEDTKKSIGDNGMQKESLIIGSKAMRALAHKSTQDSVVIHTTTAHLNLGDISAHTNCMKNMSEDDMSLQHQASAISQDSSVYYGRLGGGYVACENLANLSDETRIKIPTANAAESPPERHSMPNMFVGNRFNRTSNTAVYVPSWKDRNEMQNQSVNGLRQQSIEQCEQRNDDSDQEGVHSSALDLPAKCRLAPDKMQAELLYNFDGSCNSLADISGDIISPPTTFKQPLPIRKHSSKRRKKKKNDSGEKILKDEDKTTLDTKVGLNSSTMELCIEPQRLSSGSDGAGQRRSGSVRRCISYQYVQMSNSEAEDSEAAKTEPTAGPSRRNNNTNGNKHIPNTEHRQQQQQQQFRKDNDASNSKCKCCESSQCPSPRSSDSGMAGSCTLTSPDPPIGNGTTFGHYYHGEGYALSPPIGVAGNGGDEALFDLTRYNVCGTFREKFLTPETTQDLEDVSNNNNASNTSPASQPTTSQPEENPTTTPTNITTTTAELQINTQRSIFLNSTAAGEMPSGSSNILFTSSCERADEPEPDEPVFRSGMYAHWWKKEKLPPDVERGIASIYNKSLQSPQLSKDSYCSMCSSCVCSSGGFSEGTAYSSLCRECACCSNANSAASSNTSTTNTTSTSQCPLCNTQHSTSNDSDGINTPLANATTTTATTQSTATVSSPTSSLECPICNGLIAKLESYRSTTLAPGDEVQRSADASSGDEVAIRAVEDVASRESGDAVATHKHSSGGSSSSGHHVSFDVASVTTQTEPIVQPPLELQSVLTQSASTTSSSSTTPTKPTKSSSGAKPQIKFSPNIQQYFEDSNPNASGSGGKHGHGGGGVSSSNHKRKDRKHKS